MILGPSTPHSGKTSARSPATDAVTDKLNHRRASQHCRLARGRCWKAGPPNVRYASGSDRLLRCREMTLRAMSRREQVQQVMPAFGADRR